MDVQLLDLAGATPSASLVNLIESAAASFESDQAAAREYLFQAFALIRTHKSYQTQEPTRPRGGLVRWQLKRVLAYIDAHLDARIKARELAGELRLSLSHFSRSFKLSVGISPSHYIIRKRVQLAQRRMLESTDSLCKISADCGLSDQAHLCKAFRRVVGQSPNMWRKAYVAELRSLGDMKSPERQP